MIEGLSYGWRTAVLSVAFVQLCLIALVLLRPLENRLANRLLAALLLVMAGVITPWMIGFAGFYDKWRWLSFVPISITLAIAPLFYGYVHALLLHRGPARGWWHASPPLLQFAYLATCFTVLRQPAKNEWLGEQALAYGLITGAGVIAGLIGYGAASLRIIRAYRGALPQQVADEHRHALRWLDQALAALFVLLAAWTLFGVWDAIDPLGYTGLMGLYVAIAAVALFLAIAGLRHADRRIPPMPPTAEALPERDWAALGAQWGAEIEAQRWHRDPELNLAGLARRLGTNTGYLSRALNDGLGVSFSALVNGLRSREVGAAIANGSRDDLLELAVDAGFSSKASFNRAFRTQYGCTPSEYRRRHVSNRE